MRQLAVTQISSNHRAQIQSRLSIFITSALNHWTMRSPHCVGIEDLLEWGKKKIRSSVPGPPPETPLDCFLGSLGFAYIGLASKRRQVYWDMLCSSDFRMQGARLSTLDFLPNREPGWARLAFCQAEVCFNSPYGCHGYVAEVKGMSIVVPELLSPKLAMSFQLQSLTS